MEHFEIEVGDKEVLLDILWYKLNETVRTYDAGISHDQTIATILRVSGSLGEPFAIVGPSGSQSVAPRKSK